MTQIVFLRHFETKIEEDRPVSEWGLSEEGKEELQNLLETNILGGLDRVYSSPEHKALKTAQEISQQASIPLVQIEELREVDRSGEGFIEDQEEYVQMVETYLRNPTVPFKWENRNEVEDRIRKFLDTVDTSDERVMAAVTHGMFLSTLLPRLSDSDPYTFWQNLRFGETIKANHKELVEVMKE